MSTMASTSKKAGKGLTDGVISEMSTFYHVKEGQQEKLREAVQRFVDTVRSLPPEEAMKAGLRDSRHVIFDEGRQLVWFTTFESEWDPYIEDSIRIVGFKHFLDWMQYTIEGDKFGAWAQESGGLEALDPHNPNVEQAVGQYSGGLKKIIQAGQVQAASYFNALSAVTLIQVGKAEKLNVAFEEVLENPAAEKALQDPALKPLLELASS